MKSPMRAANETALTLEQHRALTEGRSRPLTDGAMSNAKASRWRVEQSVVEASPVDNVFDVVQRLVEARRSRTRKAS